MTHWWAVPVAACAGLAIGWLALLALLWLRRPTDTALRDILRLLPHLVRLIGRLAADQELPAGIRIRLGLLAAYLASPIDLVPDVIPILGYADDAVLVALVLRSVVRTAGAAALERHWPGTPEELELLRRLVGV